MTDTTTQDRVTVTVTAGEYEEVDNCVLPYRIQLAVGAVVHDLDGWYLCGWLAPRAHADLDGSALALWGDAQSGGWTMCDGDGTHSGLVRIDHEYACTDGDASISVLGGEGGRGAEIIPSDVPEWQALIVARDRCDRCESHDEWDRLNSLACGLRGQLRTAIAAAIDRAVGAMDVPEVDSEEIYDDLPDLDGLEDLPIRAGNWRGAGVVLAWCAGGEYDYTYWPGAGDVPRALRAIGDDTAAIIAASITASM